MNVTPYQECTELLGDAAALRAAARERGYLFFRGRLPAAAVREVRRDVLQEIQRQGYLAPDTDWDDAVAKRGTSLTAFDPNPEYRAHYTACCGCAASMPWRCIRACCRCWSCCSTSRP